MAVTINKPKMRAFGWETTLFNLYQRNVITFSVVINFGQVPFEGQDTLINWIFTNVLTGQTHSFNDFYKNETNWRSTIFYSSKENWNLQEHGLYTGVYEVKAVARLGIGRSDAYYSLDIMNTYDPLVSESLFIHNYLNSGQFYPR
mgnify:CR=1 FL=1